MQCAQLMLHQINAGYARKPCCMSDNIVKTKYIPGLVYKPSGMVTVQNMSVVKLRKHNNSFQA